MPIRPGSTALMTGVTRPSEFSVHRVHLFRTAALPAFSSPAFEIECDSYCFSMEKEDCAVLEKEVRGPSRCQVVPCGFNRCYP